MQFKDIVGQRDVANRLTEIIDSGRVSHAQLFLGGSADGCLAMALAYLQYLCCEHRVAPAADGLRADSCGECPSCKKIASLMHPDLHLVFPNAATSSVKEKPSSAEFEAEFRDFVLKFQGRGTLEDWLDWLDIEKKSAIINVRDADWVVRQLALKSYEGGWKMVLIWMPEKMNTECANKLLKTLEEPTPGTIILLAGESDERLLPTIVSRVQTVRLASSGDGATADNSQFAAMMVGWLRLLFKLRMQELSAEVDKLSAMTRDQQKQFLRYMLGVMRGCFLSSAAGIPCHIGSGDDKFDAMFPTMITKNNIELINNALNEAYRAVERNANAKIMFMQLSFNLSRALKKK